MYVDIPALRPGTVGAFAFAILCAFVAAVVRLAIDPYVAGSQYVTFHPAVIVATLIGGMRAGALCGALSFVPLGLFIRPLDPVGLLMFVAVMAFNVVVSGAMRFAVERHRQLGRTLECRIAERTTELTERNRELDAANRQFREANEEMLAMYDCGALMLGRINRDGVVVDANRACMEDLGFARSDVVGRPYCKGVWWRLSAEVEDYIHGRVAGALAGEPSRGETRFVTGNGEERVCDLSLMPIRDDDRRTASVLFAGLDVTERARQYRATFENAAVGIAHVSADLRWLRANQAMCRIVGWPMNELLSTPFADISHPDDFAVDLANIEQVRSGRIDSYDLDKRYLRKDGTIVWARLTVGSVRRPDGSLDYFVAVIEDITARRRAEEELAKSEERFRTSILHSPAPTALYDDREQIIALSQSWLAAAGLSAGDVRRIDDWTIRAHGDRSDEMLHLFRSIIATEPQGRVDELVLTLGGHKRIWSFVTSCLGALSDGRRLFVTVSQDVTDRKAYEEQLELLVREARHRTKNILGLVQAVARQTAAADPERFVETFTERIQALAGNQDLLVKNQWQGADVGDLVRVQLAHFADLVGSRITVRGPPLRLNATAAQAVGLALHELATNAGKYGALSTDGGRVDVEWRTDNGDFALAWTERGGPPVWPPERHGFGTTVIEKMAKATVGGEVNLDYAPSGLTWHLTCPAANAIEGAADTHRT